MVNGQKGIGRGDIELTKDKYPTAMGNYTLSEESFDDKPMWIKNDSHIYGQHYKFHYLHHKKENSWVVSEI